MMREEVSRLTSLAQIRFRLAPFAQSLALALTLLAAVPAAARPQEDNALVDLKDRVEAWSETQAWMGEGTFGGVVFSEDAFEDVFDKEWFPMVRIGSGWYPIENLSVGLSLGGLYEDGNAVGSLSGKTSAETTKLYIVPVQLTVRYRFLFAENQWFVPSVWAGGDYWYFQEANDEQDNVTGDKVGWHYGGDVGFLLDPLDKRAAHRMSKDWGIDDTFLTIGYESQSVGEGEDGLKFSGVVYTVGLRFEIAAHEEK